MLKPLLNDALTTANKVVQSNSPNRAAPEYRKIALPTIEGIHFEKVNDIVSLEARGNYTCIHFCSGQPLLISKTLQEVEKQLLDNDQFIRIHRSFTINMNYLLKYSKGKGGFVVLESGIKLTVSVGRKQAFLDACHQYFGCRF